MNPAGAGAAQPAALLSEEALPFRLRFYGVRGSVPVCGTGYLAMGGSTPCVAVELSPAEQPSSNPEYLILDGGTGIRSLGNTIVKQARSPAVVHLFLSHFHWDHIQGLPFFAPLYDASCRIVIYSNFPASQARAALERQMSAPFFPASLREAPATLEFRSLGEHPVPIGPLLIDSFPLHHPGQCSAFRIRHPRRTAVYATDHEHGDAALDRLLLRHAEGADLLIHDAHYTPAEYASHRGWGHSTWQHAAACAHAAQVGQLLLFHHHPDRQDAEMASLQAEARSHFARTTAAYEGLVL